MCGRCGNVLGADVAFCTACGAPRGGGAVTSPAPPAPVEDRRRVSVLFVDLVGFTPYVEHSDPELVRDLQTGFFATARQVISQYGGVVEKYIGDAVMALFGAPVATETDAVRCVLAGLKLQGALSQFTPHGSVRPRFRVGVATGEALVNLAAARDGGQAIVAGDVVNTAARLQAVAPADGVLVCGTTHAATRAAIRYTGQEPVLLRGRSTPTEVWLAQAPVGPPHQDRGPTTTPLVNRTHELELLVNAANRSLGDRMPQLVTVLGHAGIGKTRLVHEVYEHARRMPQTPMAWYTGRCPPFGENVTYAALADIVKAHAGILDSDPASTAAERLAASLRELVGPDEAGRLANALSPLVGLPKANLTADEAESAWRRFVVALASHRPTVLVFEDLHWADESMLRFIELIGASVREVPLLLLCTARPELLAQEPTWATAAGALMINLPPLRDAEVATMYTHLLGQAAFPTETLGPLVELADGNPLYAHEYTRMLVERGALRLEQPLLVGPGVPMPDSVQAVIANRVDLLEAGDRAVLQAASVVGVQFWPGAVAAAMGRPVETVERSLRRLEQRDLIHEQLTSTMAGQPEYRFGHILVRDVCYQRLPRIERIARHERTAGWLDSVAADRDTGLAETLAHHRLTAYEIARSLSLDTGRLAEAAREALHRAAYRAGALHAFDIAANHARRALSLCTDQTPAADRLPLELLAVEIDFYADDEAFLAGDGPDRLTALAGQLDASEDMACAARAWTLIGQAAWLRADRRGALRFLRKAISRYQDLPDSAEKADAYAEFGRIHMVNFEHDLAIESATTAAGIAQRLGLVEAQANARITAGCARYASGDPGGLEELRAVAEECGAKQLLALPRAIRNLISLVCEEGDWPATEALMDQSIEVAAGGNNLTSTWSEDATRAYFAGDWPRLSSAAEAVLATPSGEWDLQIRGLSTWIGLLRDAGEGAGVDGVPGLLVAGERSGFHRLRWIALAYGALCRAVEGRASEATDLLIEVVDRWRELRPMASGEWVPAAATAAALAGRTAARTVRDMLREAPRQTPWVEAALWTVAGALESGDRAAEHHVAAAKIYSSIPNQTERAVALALAVRAGRAAGRQGVSDALLVELRAFAARNGAPRLLALGDPT